MQKTWDKHFSFGNSFRLSFFLFVQQQLFCLFLSVFVVSHQFKISDQTFRFQISCLFYVGWGFEPIGWHNWHWVGIVLFFYVCFAFSFENGKLFLSKAL